MAIKPNFVRKKKRKKHGATFWDSEYKKPEHLKISTNHSGDLEKFTRWLIRQKRKDILSPTSKALDIGCGNGRNLIFLTENFGVQGLGLDISEAGIAQAVKASQNLPIKYQAGKITGELDVKENSQNLVLDMMTSHFLNQANRKTLRNEIFRVLKPGGFLFMKTFLKDGDLHTERLLKSRPGSEEGGYIHPVMGIEEYVYNEKELVEFLSEKFIIHKIYRSHKHTFRGRARKRRTITLYAEKDPYK